MLRSSSLELFADVGPIGLHGNNDTLSFTLHGPAGAIVIDPGTYCYTRDAATRNELRATAAHDTPEVDGAEIAEFDGPWRIKRDLTSPRVTDWQTRDDGGILEGEHRAYAGLPGGVVVRRRWELAGDTLRVVDRFEGSGAHRVRTRFTIPAPLLVRRVDERRVTISGPDGWEMSLQADVPLTVTAGWYSPSYGAAAPATYIIAESQAELPGQMAYLWALFASRGRDD